MRSLFSNSVTQWPGAIQLLRGGQAGRSGSDDGDALPGARFGRLGLDPAFLPGAVDDRFFDQLDGDRRLVDAQHAGRFARRRADAPGKLREIIRGMQDANRFLPVGRDTRDRSSPE